MEENISEKSGFVRLALGTGITAYGIAHLARESGSKSLGSFLVAAGAMKIAEGIFLYCPMKALINSNVKDAVSSTFNDFMDGDSIMQAFNATYQGNTSHGYATPIHDQSQSSNRTKSSSVGGESNFNGYSYGGTPDKTADYGQSQSSSGQNSDATIKEVAKAVGEAVGSGTDTVAQVASSVAETVSGSQGNKGNQGQNKQNGQKSNNNKPNNGQSATNPS